MTGKITIPTERIIRFCRENRIRRMAFFGSILRDDFGPGSDIDILVEFELGTHIGLRFFSMEIELSEIFGRKVDLNTPGFLSKDFRDKVIAESEVLYDAA